VADDRFVLSVADIELESSVLDVIRCIGSSMPVSRTLALKFSMRQGVPPTISVVRVTISDFDLLFQADFVSVFHENLPDQTRLYQCSIS
jgi:hypothetical protein